MNWFPETPGIFLIPPFIILATGLSFALLCLIKGKGRHDVLLFGVLCIGISLLSPAAIAHRLFRGDAAAIMMVERSLHAAYAFTPWIGILFFNAAAGFRCRTAGIAGFLASAVFSASAFSDRYMYGLWEYPWGYMPKGGVVLHAFAAYCVLAAAYGIGVFVRKNRSAADENERVKLRWMVFSLIMAVQLMLGNLLPINGVDFYPTGNFVFIPMIHMAWGVFKGDFIGVVKAGKIGDSSNVH